MAELAGWVPGYLLNLLWQAPVVFAAAWAATRLVRGLGPRLGPAMEHRVWVSALMMETVLPACRLPLGTWLDAWLGTWLGPMVRGLAHAFGLPGFGQTGRGTGVAVETGPALVHGALRLPAAALTGVAVAYGCGMVYFAGRLGWSLWKTYAMRREAEPVRLTGEAAQQWERLGRVFGIDYAEAGPAISPTVSGPVTVGVRRPMLLVPPGFLEEVQGGGFDGDMDVVVAHEFAHMRRQDFLKNLLYGVMTLPAACHPVLWLTRSRVAATREMVCDGLAAEAVRGRERYARSLLRLAAMLAHGQDPGGPKRAMTLHAIGIFDANLFERRVMNLTERRMEVRGMRRLGMLAACVVVGLGTCASAMALRMEVGTPVSATEKAKTGPAKVSGGVMAGNVESKVMPIYPPEAKEAKVTGAVVMKAVIGKDGTVESLEVVAGPEVLRRSALDAVSKWTYKPYLLNGEATEVETTVTVTYSLGK